MKGKCWAQSRYPELFTRTGRANNHVVHTKFKRPFVAMQQKGRSITVALQSRVEAELKRLIAEGQVKKLHSCTDDQFISTVVITVKRDGSIKLAMDSKILNVMVSKNEYQMPIIEELVDKIGQIVSSKRSGTIWFTVLDLKYAYGQLALSLDTAAQCNFALVGAPPRVPIGS